jgi:RNA polymerase sigma-70 factor, ECF subfamily
VGVSTFLSAHDHTSEVSDLRGWSEQQLIAATKTRRTDAFGELCGRHGKKVFRVVHRMMRNREDAEDAAQECFPNAFVYLKDFEGRSRFTTWLDRIAINAALMKLRKNRGAREVPIDEPNSSSEPVTQREFRHDAPDPEESCFLRKWKRIAKSAISGLRPSSQRCGAHPLTRTLNRETAQLLGISTGAVETRMFRAKIAPHRMPLLQSVGSFNCARQAE